eukprot:7000848-Karenia_brevis.AAC.1
MTMRLMVKNTFLTFESGTPPPTRGRSKSAPAVMTSVETKHSSKTWDPEDLYEILKLATFLHAIFDGIAMPQWLRCLQHSFDEARIPSDLMTVMPKWHRMIRLWTALATTMSMGSITY